MNVDETKRDETRRDRRQKSNEWFALISSGRSNTVFYSFFPDSRCRESIYILASSQSMKTRFPNKKMLFRFVEMENTQSVTSWYFRVLVQTNKKNANCCCCCYRRCNHFETDFVSRFHITNVVSFRSVFRWLDLSFRSEETTSGTRLRVSDGKHVITNRSMKWAHENAIRKAICRSYASVENISSRRVCVAHQPRQAECESRSRPNDNFIAFFLFLPNQFSTK